MTNYLRSAAVTVLICSMAVTVMAQQFYLYEPKPVPSGTSVKEGNGVLVKEVPVQSGNTLYGISRKFSGHGMYYPQILLFNNIKDPNLIHVGDTLKVPLPKGEDVSDVSSGGGNLNQKKKAAKAVVKGVDKTSSSAARKIRPVVKADVSVSPIVDQSALESGGAEKRRSSRRANASNVMPAVDSAVSPAVGVGLNKPDTVSAAGKKDTDGKKTIAASAASQLIYEKAVKAYRQEEFRTALDLFDRYLNDNPDSPLSADASLFKAECYLKLSAQ